MASVTKGFRYTGAAQTFTVPAFVTSVYFELWGAPGGEGPSLAAGVGGIPGATGSGAFNLGYSNSLVNALDYNKTMVGYVAGSLAVTPGALYTVTVGGAGGYGNANSSAHSSTTNYGPGGFNGGANGGYSAPGADGQVPGSGGGGASDIRSGGTALSNRILVAGGGGGSGGPFATSQGMLDVLAIAANPTTPKPPFTNDTTPGSGDNFGPNYYPTSGPAVGGVGGGSTGGTGGGATRGSNDNVAGSGGRGGSQTAGGAAGASTGSGSEAGAAGATGVGGAGGHVSAADHSSVPSMWAGGGGGGGGYFGGGGGASGSTASDSGLCGGGGGGGSNFVGGSFTSTANYAHVPPAGVDGQTGVNGYARMTYDQPPNPPTISNPLDGAYIDINSALAVAWSFSSLAVGEVQGGFDLAYSVHGAGIWTTFTNPANVNQTLTIAAATFTAGTDYDIRVRVYDSHGDVSSYSTVLVHAVNVPGAPTITSPTSGSTLSTDPFNVTWTVAGGVTETLYRVQALDQNGLVQVDSGDLYSTRVNACTNPSFETSTAGWITANGVTIAQSSAHSVVPSHSCKFTWATTGALTQAVLFAFPTIPGKTYTCSGSVTVDTPGTDPDVVFEAFDADGVSQIGTPQTVHVTTAGTFVRGSTTFVAQSNTSYFAVVNAGAATSGQVCYLDAVLIEYGTNVNIYFDGSNANGNPGTPSWQGTTNLSASQIAIANVLTYTVNWPLPSQPIVIRVMYADTADLNIYSPPAESTPTVNLNPPDVPVVVLDISNDAGTVTLEITNPAGTFSAVYNEVYRTDLTNDTPEVLLVTMLPPNTDFVDYTPTTQTVYAYRVRAISAIGGFADAT